MTLEELNELQAICPSAKEMAEGPHKYVHLPNLQMPSGANPAIQDALLCLTGRDGYTTRLFLEKPIAGKSFSWTSFSVLDRQWVTWSWNNVPPNLRPAEILIQHLKALR